MLFNTIEFVIFFFTVVVIYYFLPGNKWRKMFLLGASYYFYACWNVAFLAILLFETIVAYGYGRLFLKNLCIGSKSILTSTIVLLLLPLMCFKYLNFLMGSVHDVLILADVMIDVPTFQLLLPIGISFYTFMAVGYVVDVYKSKVTAELDILNFGLFIGFFPQIASGPIGRAEQLIPQLKEKRPLLYENITAGAKMMLWGFFMKLVVGDRAGIYVDKVFGNYAHHNGSSLLLATLMYSIQIYCDFAGYSLIAIGTAKTMGYELMENFRHPYFATSVADFWRRWHISLSTWFRDYVYIPCGGSRVSSLKLYRNLLITFLISGLWHGAAYNFILWGVYHAVTQIVAKIFKPYKEKIWNVLHVGDMSRMRKGIDVVLTFVIVSYGWMLFYAPDIQFIVDVTREYFHLGLPYIHPTTFFFFGIGLVLLMSKDVKDEFISKKNCDPGIYTKQSHDLFCRRTVWHYLEFALIAILIVWIGVLGGGQFIYFNF